jgi:AcrR family transcriptional regulator
VRVKPSKQASAREGARVAEMQRRRLLLAFGELLSEVGLEDTSVGHICKRAGVSRRTFYEQFEGRDDCFAVAFSSRVQEVSCEIRTVCQAQEDWRTRIHDGLEILLRSFDRHPGFAHMCLVESLKGGDRVMRLRAQVLDSLARAVDEGRLVAKRGSEPPPLTGQGVIGGVQTVLHGRLMEPDSPGFLELSRSLMGMIVYPYLGAAAAKRELELEQAVADGPIPASEKDPFKDLPIRFTYRTARVLAMIASEPGASNRAIATNSGIADEGQMSRLLRRLQSFELIENLSGGQLKGVPNAWALTERGESIHHAISAQDSSLP